MFENSLMLSQNSKISTYSHLVCLKKQFTFIFILANVQLSSMIHILKSLTQNAKNIFLVMVQHVLNPDNAKKSID